MDSQLYTIYGEDIQLKTIIQKFNVCFILVHQRLERRIPANGTLKQTHGSAAV